MSQQVAQEPGLQASILTRLGGDQGLRSLRSQVSLREAARERSSLSEHPPEVPRLGVESELQLQLPGVHHSCSNTRSEPHLRPTPQLMTTPDP